MAGGSLDDEEITGINVTPLVDVMLVLLIIFMVTASYIVNQGIQVQLPTADTGSATDARTNLAFVLAKNGELYLDGQEIKLVELEEKVASIRAEKQGTQISALISADKETPHGEVVKLIDAVRKNGINDFAINVEPGA